jgi:hypothetical protein
MRRPPDLADARAALWAWRAVRGARAQLRDGAVRDVRLPAPPPVARRAERAVRRVLSRLEPSCLEGALVRQRWLAAHGVARDVVVGTEGASRGPFAAHAWLDGEAQPDGHRFVEILRLAP